MLTKVDLLSSSDLPHSFKAEKGTEQQDCVKDIQHIAA